MTAKKRRAPGGGRKVAEHPQDKVIAIRLDGALYSATVQAADSAGVATSAWVRALIEREFAGL